MMRTVAGRLSGFAVLHAFVAVMLMGAPAHGQGTLEGVMKSGKLRVAIIGGNPPYSRLSPSGEPEGYDIDIAKRIAEALNVEPEFTTTDIPGRVTVLQTGKADLTIADFTKTVQRSTSIAFTDPYLVVSLQFLVKADRDDLQTVEDINKSGVTVGITRGGTAEQNVPLAAPEASIARFNDEADILAAVNTGQVDVMSQDNLYNAELMKNHPGQYKVLPGLYSHEEIAIGLPAGDFDWWRVLNAWVEQFNASGDNARLFKQWFGYDLPPIQTQY
jgi:polar amino acid transport system substrate-binding protein